MRNQQPTTESGRGYQDWQAILAREEARLAAVEEVDGSPWRDWRFCLLAAVGAALAVAAAVARWAR